MSATHSNTSGCSKVMSALAMLKIIDEKLLAVLTSVSFYHAVIGSVLSKRVVTSILYIPLWKSCVAMLTI